MNDLTEKLLAEGYTKDNHPDYVEWSNNWKQFEYTMQYLRDTVWETPCGLLKKGISSYNHMSHLGVDYCPENNNPRYGCPYYDEKPCPYRIETKKLWGCNCIYHQTDREYDYENSVEKLWNEWDRIKNEAWQKVIEGYGFCSCMKWNRTKRQYEPNYDVENCISNKCKNEVCAITKKPRNLKKVNIYYDLLRITRYKQGLLEHEIKRIEKGIKKFEKPVARTDAEIWLKTYKDKFEPLHNREDRSNVFFSEYHGKTGFGDYDWFEFTTIPQNIRIEHRESRDLLQDLQDAQEGIEVVHASDLIKRKKEIKKEARERRNAPEQKVRKLVKRWGKDVLRDVVRLNDEGYCPEEISAELEMANKYYIEKILKIEGLEELLEDKEKPVSEYKQMSLI